MAFPIKIDIKEEGTHPQKYYITKVYGGLRNVNPEAYEPMVVSIGPYHHDHHQNPKLEAMEIHKRRYLNSCLGRTGKSKDTCISALKKLEQEARRHYVDLPESLDFVEMMLHDGCFIIEFFRRINSRKEIKDEDCNFINVVWMRTRICLDLILLENQLPYVVLDNLHTMMSNNEQEGGSFKDVAIKAFDTLLPKPQPGFKYAGGNDIKEIKHLLHLAYVLVCPINRNPSKARKCVSASPHELSDQNRPLLDKDDAENDNNAKKDDEMRSVGKLQEPKIRSVVKLQEAAVKFKKAEGGNCKGNETSNLLGIKFNEGCLELPPFRVEGSTETFFRNLIAYEQHLIDDSEPRSFTEFVEFMDQLIDSEDDVKVLCDKGIIVNWLGDDKAVVELFNKLCKGAFLFYSSSKYSNTCRDLNAQCDKNWNRLMASLKGYYFKNPWITLSKIAAAVLLILTLMQTVLAFKNG